MLCESCDALVINGLLCHEQGCPDAYKTETRKCRRCGNTFSPEDQDQRFCDTECAQAYWD